MRKAVFVSMIVSVPLLFSASGAGAQGLGSSAEAKAMLERAVAELKADPAAALEKFKKGEAGFKDRDLYVFCFDTVSGQWTWHPTLMGNDVRALKDKTGAPAGEKLYAAAEEGTVTSVEYMFPKPGGTEPVAKETFVTKVGNQGCGVGYYK
jgi:signal transduction histidine kinase